MEWQIHVTMIPAMVPDRSSEPFIVRPTGSRESLLLLRVADTVPVRAFLGSPQRSTGEAGNYSVPQGMPAITDECRRFHPVTTGRGRVEPSSYPLEDCCVSRAPITRDQAAAQERHPHLAVLPLDPRKMSVKQLAQTVRYGRKITFLVFDGDPITGYLGGMDEEYFYVLSPIHEGFERWVINRAGNPAFMLHAEATYDGEPQREAMEEIIGRFRGWISKNILNGQRSDSDARKAG
jgi:hypothetical protein